MDEHEREHWVNGLKEYDWQNELIAFGVMCAFMKPQTWLDIGCGTGAMVKTAIRNGVAAFGVDQIAENSEQFKQHDLTQPLDLGRKFALVTTIEFVEHLPEQFEGVICDTITRHIAPGGRLIFTAAVPGQGGYNHFNCQPPKYWTDRLTSRGLTYNVAETRRIAAIWKNTFTTLNHLSENVQVFNRELS